MKTDRFDEEFRRKLLGLPAEVDPGEVERIQGFVNTNGPAFPNWGWGKLLLYGGSSLLLIGSLSYNVIQTYRNTHLQSSIDSLVHRPVDRPSSSAIIRHDTVYITQSGNAVEPTSLPTTSIQTNRQKPLEQTNTNQPADSQRIGSVAMERPKLLKSGREGASNQSEIASPYSESRPNEPVATNASAGRNKRSEERERSGQVRSEANESLASVPPVAVGQSTTEKVRLTNETEILSKSRASAKRQTISGNENNGLLVTNYSRKRNQRTIDSPPMAGFTPVNTENGKSNTLISEVNRQAITAEPLTSLRISTTSNKLAIMSPSRLRPMLTPLAPLLATRRSWHLTMPNLSVPNAQYRIGAGFTGGSDQVGAALLGEIMLNRHWSVQAGLQLGYNQGFHYRDENDFNEHQKDDFRQTYASQVSSSSTIQDIQQMTLLVQVPIQIAYHYPFGRQWGVRLGLGTDLNLWGRSAVSFDYRENSRSSEHELSRSKEHVYVVNNLTLSTAIERSWKKWLFRAGPFISPQLRPVDYKRDDLFWGGNLQVLYRLGK